MDLKELLSYPPILESVCQNLTFEQAIKLKKVLNLESLNCQISISDSDNQINSFDRINATAILVYPYIQKFGSNNALIKAVKNNELYVVRFLLLHEININVTDSDGNTPLLQASLNGNIQMVKLLLFKGADINKPNNAGWTPLFSATLNGHDQIIKILLANGLKMTDTDEKLSLGIAILNDRISVINLLLERKIDVNYFDLFDKTPLMLAAEHGYLKIVQILLDYGSKVGMTNQNGLTALLFAQLHNHKKVAELLISYGA